MERGLTVRALHCCCWSADWRLRSATSSCKAVLSCWSVPSWAWAWDSDSWALSRAACKHRGKPALSLWWAHVILCAARLKQGMVRITSRDVRAQP